MSETAIIGFYRDLQCFNALAVVVNKDLAIVPPSNLNGWILVIRKHGVIIVETVTIDTCFYLAKLLIDRKVDFDESDSINSALIEVFGQLEDIARSTRHMLEARWELVESGDIRK